MNAPPRPTTRAQEQALSAPFLIEDEEVVRTVAQIADERGTPMAEIVRLAVADYLKRHEAGRPTATWLQKYWAAHPLPLPTGLVADKRFYDSLSDEL